MKDYNYWRQRYLAISHDLAQFTLDHARDMTPIEGIAFFLLKNLQLFYGVYYLVITPQAQLEKYKVDFLVVLEIPELPAKKVVIECDGHDFHEKTKTQASKDKQRDRELQKMGYTVLRYSGSDIVNDPSVIRKDLESIFGVPEWVRSDERGVSNE